MTKNGELVAYNVPPTSHEMTVYQYMAEQAVTSKMYRGIGDQAGVMMIMLSARELGIPPMQALNGGINIIQGKVEISARMMSALIRKAGHTIQVKESTELECVLVGKRSDTNETLTASFSVQEAQKAGLVKPGGGWTKWPKDMCFARALSRLARQLFSDVIGIGYVEGEIKDAYECKTALHEEDHHEPEIIIDDEEEWVKRYLDLFQKEEHFLAMQYFDHVMNHFKWTKTQTAQELLKAKDKIHEKFLSWKNKHKL